MLYHCHLRHDSKITQRRDLFPNLPSKIAPPPPKRKEKEKEKKKLTHEEVVMYISQMPFQSFVFKVVC